MTDRVTTSLPADARAGFDERMVVLRRRFVERVFQDHATIRGLRRRFHGGDALAGAPSKELQRTVHGLSGVAGVFGYDDVSEAAHLVERRLRDADGPVDVDPLLDALEAVLDRIERAETATD